MRTPLCDLVGIEAPVVLAPMGGAVTPRLAAAVSNADGLGLLPLTRASPDEIVSIIDETRQLTGRPFGVNLGWAGQGIRLVTREESAAAIVASIVSEAEDITKSLA